MIRIGIIGAGRIGFVHAQTITLRVPSAKLVAVADAYLNDHIRDWATKMGVEQITDRYQDILERPDIDAVFICTSTDLHTKISLEAIAAGKHVFCEKPVALTLDEIYQVEEALKGKNLKYQVGFNQRLDENYAAIKKAIDNGTVGDPYMVKITSRDPAPPPVGYIKTSGGLFLDMTIHDFDLSRFLMGCEPVEVMATGACRIDPEIGEAGDIDIGVVMLTMENGAIVTIENSRQCGYGYDQRVEVFGSKGMAYAENQTPTRTTIATKDGIIGPLPEGFFLERYKTSYAEETIRFVDAIENDKEVNAGIRDGLMNAVVGMAAQKAMRERRVVKISEIKLREKEAVSDE